MSNEFSRHQNQNDTVRGGMSRAAVERIAGTLEGLFCRYSDLVEGLVGEEADLVFYGPNFAPHLPKKVRSFIDSHATGAGGDSLADIMEQVLALSVELEEIKFLVDNPGI